MTPSPTRPGPEMGRRDGRGVASLPLSLFMHPSARLPARPPLPLQVPSALKLALFFILRRSDDFDTESASSQIKYLF